jgi:hypothetical protein
MSAARTTSRERRAGGTAWIAGRRAALATAAFAVALLVGAVVLLGTGGSDGHGHGTVARVVAVPGGAMRIDSITPDTPMTMSGMPMPSGPNVKDVPTGFRRFTVAVTLFAEGSRGMHVTPDRFRITAAGKAPRPPIDDDRDDVYVPRGTAYPREVTFDVPKHAKTAKLTIQGGERAIALRLGAAPPAPGDHAHG